MMVVVVLMLPPQLGSGNDGGQGYGGNPGPPRVNKRPHPPSFRMNTAGAGAGAGNSPLRHWLPQHRDLTVVVVVAAVGASAVAG